jgi:poly(A) polymerase
MGLLLNGQARREDGATEASIGMRSWMRPAFPVLDALEARGGPDCARFVGGCVRGAVMNMPVADVDIATTLRPDHVLEALEAAGLRAEPTGLIHGTVTAVVQGEGYEVTTLRRDVTTDGRRATVAFTESWAEDAERRDFRLNALYADREGRVYDPAGGGLEDAREGRVVFVGDPETRIREDYLRILRFFRFQALCGRGEPDAAALAACNALKEGLHQLSAERVAKELLKLFEAPDPRHVLRAMGAVGALPIVLPEATSLLRFENLVGIETEQLYEDPDAELRLAAAIAPGRAEAAGARLKLSTAQRDRLVAAEDDGLVRIVSWMSPREARRAVYRLGGRTFRDRVMLAWAADPRPVTTPQWRGLLMLGATWSPPPFPITGEQILAAGVPEGPLVGRVRKEVEDWWIDLDFIDDRLSAVERLKAVAQGLAY